MAIKDKPRVGSLSKRITFQKRTTTTDSQGGRAESWADVVTVAAKVNSKEYSRALEAQQETYNQAYDIFIRASISQLISPVDYRIRYNGKLLTIHSILDLDEQNRYYKILAYRKV